MWKPSRSISTRKKGNRLSPNPNAPASVTDHHLGCMHEWCLAILGVACWKVKFVKFMVVTAWPGPFDSEIHNNFVRLGGDKEPPRSAYMEVQARSSASGVLAGAKTWRPAPESSFGTAKIQ